MRPAVFYRDEYRCVRCESTKNLTVDHILPVRDGGTNTFDNLQTLCEPCHKLKSLQDDGVARVWRIRYYSKQLRQTQYWSAAGWTQNKLLSYAYTSRAQSRLSFPVAVQAAAAISDARVTIVRGTIPIAISNSLSV